MVEWIKRDKREKIKNMGWMLIRIIETIFVINSYLQEIKHTHT